MDPNCVFCKIIAGEIPSFKVFENDDVLAFLDLSQVTPGHTLMVPKKHLANIYEYSEEDAKRYLKYLPVIARKVRNFSEDIVGLNILNNNEAPAFQSVMHSHFHFLPRYGDSDAFGLKWADNSEHYSTEQYEEIAQKIQATKEN